jgi:hypothetical protein
MIWALKILRCDRDEFDGYLSEMSLRFIIKTNCIYIILIFIIHFLRNLLENLPSKAGSKYTLEIEQIGGGLELLSLDSTRKCKRVIEEYLER